MTDLQIRPLGAGDVDAALALYSELTFGPPATDADAYLQVIGHEGTTIFGAIVEAELVGMVTLHVLPNVTWSARPYALIENVIVTRAVRGKGIGKALLHAARDYAWAQDCYKIMLMTGSKRGAEDFYRAAGFNSEDKSAMVMRRA